MSKIAVKVKAAYYGAIAYPFVRWVGKILAKKFFNYSVKESGEEQIFLPEPFILVCNHQTDFDVALIMCKIKNRLRLVASEHVIRLPIFGIIVQCFLQPITVFKGSVKVSGVRKILSAVRKGENVCFFPEGCRCYDGTTGEILESTGKLIKSAGCNLVTARIKGGYFISPRWSNTMRKGRATLEIVQVVSKESLEQLSDSQVNQLIVRDIFEDDYAFEAVHEYQYLTKGHGAEGIENFIFICPNCGNIGSIYGKGDHVYCKECDFTATYDEHGRIQGEGITSLKTMHQWGQYQNQQFSQWYFSKSQDEVLFYNNNIRLVSVDQKHKEKLLGIGTLKGYKTGFLFNDQWYDFDELQTIDQVGKGNNLFFHKDGVHYELWGDQLCGLQYRKLYEEKKNSKLQKKVVP